MNNAILIGKQHSECLSCSCRGKPQQIPNAGDVEFRLHQKILTGITSKIIIISAFLAPRKIEPSGMQELEPRSLNASEENAHGRVATGMTRALFKLTTFTEMAIKRNLLAINCLSSLEICQRKTFTQIINCFVPITTGLNAGKIKNFLAQIISSLKVI